MLIANNCTRESGSFCGDQLCALKAAYMFVRNMLGVDKVIMSVSPGNEMHFLWSRFIRDPMGDGTVSRVELVHDTWNPGDWPARWQAWDRWRRDRHIEGRPFDHYRELYLRIHSGQRQGAICGGERGLGRRNIYEWWCAGQEDMADTFPGSDVYDVEIDHPPLTADRDVYVSPHCKTQGNHVFTFAYWDLVVHRLIDAGLTVTVGYDGFFCNDLDGHPLYRRHWGDHRQWMEQVCRHKIVACGNTGTGWLAAACGVPLLTMEPPNSVMADHRYRECGLRNMIGMLHEPDVDDCVRRLVQHCYPDDRARLMRSRMSEVCAAAALYSVNPFDKLMLLAGELLSVVHLPGHVCDLGACRGGTSMVMRRVAPHKPLNVFDTWDGNPHDDPLCHHRLGEWKADKEECGRLIGGCTPDGMRDVWLIGGVFPHNAETESLRPYNVCFVYVDMDTYQSTRDAIEFFWPRLVPGGKMVFDDYGWEPCAGVRKAVDEFVASRPDNFAGACRPGLYAYVMEKQWSTGKPS